MKKIILTLAVLGSLVTACSSDDSEETQSLANNQQAVVDMSDFFIPTIESYENSVLDDDALSRKSDNGNIHKCYSVQVLNRQLQENPSLYNKMYNIEKNSRQFIQAERESLKSGNTDRLAAYDNLGVINIPIYVHVVYSNWQKNISDAQIRSQIDVLNQDFRARNADTYNVPSEFAGLVADTEINFSLAGIYRHSNSNSSWGTNDAVKYTYPPISPETHLNIWICNIGGGTLGYAQFPGGSPATDGVVISPQYFGTTGYVSAPYNKGRTATHEIGHYLNLRHIWGDGNCYQDDFVSDTPASDRANYGCPSYPTVNCRSNDMTMNYMDYTNDACMNMFSKGQKARMRAIFAYNGPRAAMVLN